MQTCVCHRCRRDPTRSTLHHPPAYGDLNLRSPKTFTSSAPDTNPPTCAQNATPPMFCPCTASAVAVPLRKFRTNQYPRMTHAGTHSTNTKNHVSTRAFGYRTKYAPRTPAIAPLAPRVGTVECKLIATC